MSKVKRTTPASPTRAPSKSKILPRDPWIQTDVWVEGEEDDPWRPGVCISRCMASDSSPGGVAKWKFTVDLLKNGRVEIITNALDSECLEFAAVKRRDEGMLATSINDMTYLSFLNEAEMLECLKRRYLTKEVLQGYIDADLVDATKLGPHVYQVASRAYSQMLLDKFDPESRENQSILVSGESGAGKTESTKHILHYLAVLSCQIADGLGVVCDGGDFESLITAAIPITESFGNATTSRNNNSSRFAKFIELLYTADGYIDGAVISTYLLETVRVAHQMSGERNFHIFYELFSGLSVDQKSDWNFNSLEDFAYTSQSGTYARKDGISDHENFLKLENAMNQMNMSDFEQEDIFKVLIAILHIGNIQFQESEEAGDDGSLFTDSSLPHVNCICEFLGLEAEALLKALTKRTITVAGSEVHKSLNVAAAAVSRDTSAKYLYELVFNSMIRDINTSIAMEDMSHVASYIGILDISGFEHFATNSFEQLCINYTNEKLQDHFNFSIFINQREVYQQEGIAWRCNTYPDSSEMLELFENKACGIFSLCDEQLKFPRPTDTQLLTSLVAKCSSNMLFETTRASKVKGIFIVKHFAVDVPYDTTGFLDKNRNEVAANIINCFASSLRSVMCRIRGVQNQRSALLRRAHSSFQSAPTKSIAVINKKSVSLAAQFLKDLQNLMEKIRTTRSHFVRCVKPNVKLVANCFDYDMTMKQLRCGGALDTLRVFRTGFSNRMDFQFFVTRYALFLTICGFNSVTRGFVNFLKIARQTAAKKHWKSAAFHLIDLIPGTVLILNWLQYGEHDRAKGISLDAEKIKEGLQVGRGQIFCRAHIFEYLEMFRKLSLDHVAQDLQRRRKARILSKYMDTAGHAAYLCTLAIIYFSDFRLRKARKYIFSSFIVQRRFRVYLSVIRRKQSLRHVVKFQSIVRRFLAKLLNSKLRKLLPIRRNAAVRKIQCRWKKFMLSPNKEPAQQKERMKSKFELELEAFLKERNDRIELLSRDINALKEKESSLAKENHELRTQLNTMTSSSVTNSIEEVKIDDNCITTESCPEMLQNSSTTTELNGVKNCSVSANMREIRRRGSDRESIIAPMTVAVTEYIRLRSYEAVFVIVICMRSYEWSAVRSYRDFRALRTQVKYLVGPDIDALFPGPIFHVIKLSDDEAESRRIGLDRYLSRVSESLDVNTSAGSFELLLDFFGADEVEVVKNPKNILSA